MKSAHRDEANKEKMESVPTAVVPVAAEPVAVTLAVVAPAVVAPAGGSAVMASVLGADSFPVVGIGASAGGLAALEAFFVGMPAGVELGMAFVVVQHLDPNHKSLLSELVRRYTRMEVFDVEDGVTVQPNCIYIIPPNSDMAFLSGTLVLLEPSAPRGQRLPVNFFFRSLAQELGDRAIGIVLSGTGCDGAIGVRAIKDEGGLVMVQALSTTQYDGMPRSAIATGAVDFELPPGEMPAKLIALTGRSGGSLHTPVVEPAFMNESALKKIFILVRSQTGHDFSQYKPSTIRRRIWRRMAAQQIDTADKYVQYLQSWPAEIGALFSDLLIGVTSFFRDPEVFQMLEEQVIPELFAGKSPGSTIRVWVPGCSTGEEAYSIAILMQERLDALKQWYKIQIFATDIDGQAIAKGRAGVYPASIAASLSQERLARFFTGGTGGAEYRIHKGLRDMLVFSEQDVIKNPPFSKLDMISCRNLLIYMGGELQKKLIPLFHYALNPGGTLLLGTSESVGEFNDLFETLDRKQKLYRRTDESSGTKSVIMSSNLPAVKGATAGKVVGGPFLSLRELTEQALLQQVAPAGALVNASGDIIYLHGRTGLYLEPSQGVPGDSNILKMAREGLRYELSVALHKAVVSQARVCCPGLRVRASADNGEGATVHLTVCPATMLPAGASSVPLYLVILEKALAGSLPAPRAVLEAGGAATSPGTEAGGQMIAVLQEQLRAKEEYLQSANEEMETSNEELKSSNEELQSVNEELQSSNEELETSKEELQSMNEELATVNAELQAKVIDLSRSNNDMNNLLAGTGIGTIFVDHQLCVLRFTPAVTQVINLIPGDVGRPLSHIQTKLVGCDRLSDDLQSVLDTLVSRDVEVQTRAGEWYMMRLQPYRTLENVIEGVVLTFVCITQTVKAREAEQRARDVLRLAAVARDSRDAIIVQDMVGRIISWNPAAVKLYGWTEAEALAMNVQELFPESQRAEAMVRLHQLSRKEVLQPYNSQRIKKDGSVVEASVVATALVSEAGVMYAISTVERVVPPPAKREV